MEDSTEAWVDLCAKQLATRRPDLSRVQCLVCAKKLRTNGGSGMGPIEAANLFADLSELCEKRENGEEGCP